MPPAHLRVYYYRTWSPKAFTRAGEVARTELTIRGLRPEHRVLDIGSGIGNLAISLAGYLHGGYDGVEIHPEAVAWCQRTITPRHPGFGFIVPMWQAVHTIHMGWCPPRPTDSLSRTRASTSFSSHQCSRTCCPKPSNIICTKYHASSCRDGVCVASYFLLTTKLVRESTRPQLMTFSVQHSSGLCRL